MVMIMNSFFKISLACALLFGWGLRRRGKRSIWTGSVWKHYRSCNNGREWYESCCLLRQ